MINYLKNEVNRAMTDKTKIDMNEMNMEDIFGLQKELNNLAIKIFRVSKNPN